MINELRIHQEMSQADRSPACIPGLLAPVVPLPDSSALPAPDSQNPVRIGLTMYCRGTKYTTLHPLKRMAIPSLGNGIQYKISVSNVMRCENQGVDCS